MESRTLRRSKDALVAVGTIIALGLASVPRLVLAFLVGVGILISFAPGLPDILTSLGLPIVPTFFAWCAKRLFPLALLLFALQLRRVSRALRDVEATLGNHDLILGGLASYLEIEDYKHPDQDRLFSLSLADKYREAWGRFALGFVPILGGFAKEHARFRVYATEVLRNGKPATLREDLRAQARGSSGPPGC